MAEEKIEVSIIIPVKDQPGKLEKLLKSIEEHKPAGIPYEVIVVDDASFESLKTVSEKHNAKHLRLDNCLGPANGRNEGSKLARGEILLFLDADVVYPKGLMERACGDLNADPDLSSVSFMNQAYSANDGIVKNFGSVIEHYWGLKLFDEHEVVAHSVGFTSRNGAVRKEVFKKLGGFDTSYKTNAVEDYDFGKRLSAGFKTSFVTMPIVYHNFPDSLYRLMRNYFVRASLFIQYQLKKRPGLDKTQTTGSEMVLRLLGFASLILLLAAPLSASPNFLTTAVGVGFLGTYIYMIRNLLYSAMQWSFNPAFPIKFFAIHYASNPAIVLGSAYGLLLFLSQSRLIKAGVSMGKAAIRGDIKYLIFHVTSKCNAGCRMCFNWDGMKEREGEPDISLENIKKVSKSIGHLPQLTLSGGEPLLRGDVPEILNAFYQNAGTRFFTVPTNALMPDRVEALIENFSHNCPEGFLNFCLPFHGEEKLFDEIMGVPGAFGKFRETYTAIKNAKAKHENISASLNFVMSRFNHEHYKSVIDMAEKEFPDALIGIALARGETHEKEAVDFPIESYQAAYSYLLEKKRGNGSFNPFTVMHSSIAKQMESTVTGVIRGDIDSLNCKAGRNLVVIYENGRVYPCELLEVNGVPKGDGAPKSASLGNLSDFDYNIKALLKSDMAQKLTGWIDSQKCSCTWECAIYSTIIHSPASLARLGANAVRYFIRR